MSRTLTKAQDNNSEMSHREWHMLSGDFNLDILPLEQEERSNGLYFKVPKIQKEDA